MQPFDIVFTIIWIGIVFFLVRFLGQRIFSLPEKYRPDVAAVSIVLAFVIGLFWPFSSRNVSGQPAGTEVAVATPAPICNSPGPHQATLIRAIRQAQGSGYTGGVDALLPDPSFPASTTTFRTGCNIYASGWVADLRTKTPVPGIGFVIDSERVINASASYGQSRPDVAKGLDAPGVLLCGFWHVEIATTGLQPGPHTIQVVALSKDGKLYHPIGQPMPITLQ